MEQCYSAFMEYLNKIIFASFCLILAGIIYTLIQSYFLNIQVKYWKKIRGTVTSASIAFRRRNITQKDFYTVVEYSYFIDGKEYSNDKIRLTLFSGPSLEYPLNTYKVGQHVDVYYNPQNPSQSVLELMKKQDSYILPLLSIALVVVAGVLLVMKYGYSG